MMPTPTIPARDTLAGLLERFTQVVRLVRPVGAPAPAYVRCAGCRKGGRDDQAVPDPDQFVKAKTQKVVGDPATVPADVEDEPVAWGGFNTDPGAAAERLSDLRAKQEKDGTAVKLIDAAPVWCDECRAWYHAIKCYSLHRHD
jgi:hypothetical protein